MTALRLTLCAALLAGVSACGTTAPFSNGPEMHRASGSPLQEAAGARALAEPMQLVDYEITVPEDLTTTEANLYYPVADIVWRGDPYGDRKEQVGKIFQASLSEARGVATEGRPVKAEIVINRFHSVTEKTRYTVGGVHSISFFVTLRDVRTGEALVRNRKVKADLNAFGGMRAKRAESQGLGMKERIQMHLTRVLAAELTLPGGWKDQGRTLSRAIDQI